MIIVTNFDVKNINLFVTRRGFRLLFIANKCGELICKNPFTDCPSDRLTNGTSAYYGIKITYCWFYSRLRYKNIRRALTISICQYPDERANPGQIPKQTSFLGNIGFMTIIDSNTPP